MSVKRAFSFRRITGLTAAVSFVSAFFLVISFLPSVQTANACPEEPPVPLRQLYMQSDRVVVATVSGSSVDKVESEDENGKSVTVKISLNVSETLKGEGTKPLIHIYQWQYISNVPDPEPGTGENESDEEDYEGYNNSKRFEKGKKLLLFLNKEDDDENESKGKKSTRFALADYRYGAKDLSSSDLSVYVKRIKELSTILKNKQPDKKEIIDWLVSCAEEPATRWEGAYDLNRSFNLKTYEEENEKEANSESKEVSDATESSHPEDAEAANAENTDEIIEEEYEEPFSSDLARLVTDSHKQRLSNALYQTKKLSAGDYQLISLVKNWEGKKVAAFLLPLLRTMGQEDPESAANLMNQIAGTIDDKELTRLTNLYDQLYYLDKDDEVDLDELEAALQNYEQPEVATEESEEANGAEEASLPAQNDEATSEKEQANGEKKEEKAKPKAGEVRNDILERFVSLCENLLAKE